MIFKDIAEYEDSDSQLAKDTISKLNNEISDLKEENERLKEIAHKMHLYIFLNTSDEQKAYDEIGLTKEENELLGYSGQYKFKVNGGDKK